MGTTCASDRKIRSSSSNNFYNLSLTGIPSYDKVYQECQRHADRFAEVKQIYEEARTELVAVVGAEIVTPEVYADSIDFLITRLIENYVIEEKSIQFVEKHPFLLIDSQSDANLIRSLQPVIKFITILHKTQQEMVKLEVSLLADKRNVCAMLSNYEENAIKVGLNDFDRVIGREIAKKNVYKMTSVAMELKAYYEELQMISVSLPKFLSKAKERISKKFAYVELPEKTIFAEMN